MLNDLWNANRNAGAADAEYPAARLAALESENCQLRAVVDNFPGGILLYDSDLKLVLCNDLQKKLLEYPPALFEYGLPSLEQIIRFNAVRGEYGPGDVEAHVQDRMRLAALRVPHHYRRRRPCGTVLEVRGVPLPGGGFLTTYIDVSGEQPPAMPPAGPESGPALADPVTSLPNWALFLDRLGQTQARVRRGQVAAIHYVDLDHFRQVESRLGPRVAEALVRGVALRIKNTARATDTVTRMGDDEFVVLQAEVDRPSSVARLTKRIIEAIKQPFDIANYNIVIDASIGVAMMPRDGTSAEELIGKAKANLRRVRSESGESDALQSASNPVIAV